MTGFGEGRFPGHTDESRAAFPGLGFDPCPGDQRTVDSVAATVRRAARALADISQVLEGRGRGDWEGRTATEFRRQFEEDFRPKVAEARDSFSRSAKALEEWAAYIPPRQLRARGLEDEALAAQRAIGNAEAHLGDLPAEHSPFSPVEDPLAGKDRQKLEDDRSGAESAVESAKQELERIRGRATALAERYQEEGERIADRLKKALDVAPDEPGLLDKIGGAIGGIGETLGSVLETMAEITDQLFDDILQWVQDHAHAIAAIGDVFAAVSAVLGAVSFYLFQVARFYPPVGLAAAGVGSASSATAGVALVTHGSARLAGAEVTNETLVQDGVGLLPFGGSIRFLGNTSRAIAGSRHAQGASLMGLGDSWRTIVMDPKVFDHFTPKGNRQRAEMFLPGGGGPLLVAFENAWKSGSEKDRLERSGAK